MNNNLMIFENPEFGAVRSILIDGDPWFVGKDVASSLGYSNHRKALLDHVDGEDKLDGVTIRDPIGRGQKPIFISESGLYSLILSCKLERAKKFKRWVTAEVLPSIRKHGAYMTDALLSRMDENPELILEYIGKLRAENAKANAAREALKKAEAENARLAPKASYYDSFVGVESVTCLRYTAKELGVPEKQFTRYLEEKKYLFRDKNRKLFPRAVKKSAGLFLVRDFYTERGKLGHYTLITPAGKRHFLERTDEILFE